MSNQCSWKIYFKELLKNLNDYVNRDRKKDTSIIINDLSNPNITAQEIIRPAKGIE